MGYWVDHPDRPVPPSNPCNVYAEANLRYLGALGYHPYYLVAYLTRGPFAGETHIMAATDLRGYTLVLDNLHPGEWLTADQLEHDGYLFIGRELSGRWYAVRQ